MKNKSGSTKRSSAPEDRTPAAGHTSSEEWVLVDEGHDLWMRKSMVDAILEQDREGEWHSADSFEELMADLDAYYATRH